MFKMSNRLPSDDIKKANSHVSLEFRGEVQTGDTNLRVISMEVIFLFLSFFHCGLGIYII